MTIGYTSWSEGHATVPLSIILELDATCQDLTQLRYLPRQDKKGQDYQWNGDILNYEIWVSTTDTEESSFQKIAEGSWAEDKEEKCASFSPVSAKYVKLTAIHTKGNNANEYDQYASAAEINLASGGMVDLEADKKGLIDAIAKAQAYLEGVGADETGISVLRGLLEKGNTIAAYQCPVEEELQEVTQAILTETNRLETGAPAITYENFTPNSQWMDNTNVMIQAHGGGIIWDEKTQKYYWYGEHKGEDKTTTGGIVAIGVTCYSSTDLYNWKNEGVALPVFNNPAFLTEGEATAETPLYLAESSEEYQAAKAAGKAVSEYDTLEKYNTTSYIAKLNALYEHTSVAEKQALYNKLNWNCVMERPKVIYNKKNDNYVMWFHKDGEGIGNYSLAQTGIAVSDSPTGPFKLIDTINPNGKESRDMTLYVDEDGTAYLLHSSEDNWTLYLAELNEDYTGLTGNYSRNYIDKNGSKGVYAREAPAIFKYHGNYYIISSGCTGWNPNQMGYSVTDDIRKGMSVEGGNGPFQMDKLKNPCVGTDANISFGGQSTYVLPVQGKEGYFIYMGDKWNSKNLKDSRYQWLPIQIDDEETTLTISWNDTWTLEDFEKLNNQDRINLNRVIRAGRNLSAQEYNFGQERWNTLQNLLTEAINLSYQADSATVTGKTVAIQQAIQALQKWKVLDAAFLQVENRAEAEFTPETWKNLQAAYENGKLLGEDATQEQIQTATTAILEAINKLEAIEMITEEISLVGKSILTDSQYSENEAEKAIDGDNNTFWHSDWKNATPLPHYLTIDLGESYNDLYQLNYIPRQDKDNNGIVTKYRILISNAKKTLNELMDEDFEEVRAGSWEADKNEKTTVFRTKNAARYLRFEVLEGVGDLASAAELKLLRGTPKEEPESPEKPWIATLEKAIKDYMVADSNEKDYTTESWKAYKTAYQAALDLQKKYNYTEAEVTTMVANLKKAYEELKKAEQPTPKPWIATLEKAIKDYTVADSNKGLYTEASWKAYKTAYQAALDLQKKYNYTEAEVTTVVANLKKAYEELKKAEQPTPKPWIATLEKAIKDYTIADSKKGLYTEASWKAYKTAYQAALDLQKKDNYTEAEVTTVVANLKKAYQGLKKKPAPVKVKTIKITGSLTKLAKGKKVTLKTTVTPKNATNKSVTWSSSNQKVAKVSQKGVVTAVKKGTANITAKAKDGSKVKSKVYKITVVDHAVKKVSLKTENKTVAAGKKATIKATISTTGKNANKTLKWSTSNKKYATVSSKGVVTTKKAGAGKTVKITAQATDGSNKKASISIKIVKHAVKSVKLSGSKSVKAGKKVTIKATVKTTGKTASKKLVWSTSNKKYATVSSKGVVSTKKAGKGKTVTITAKATDGSGKKGTIKIKMK